MTPRGQRKTTHAIALLGAWRSVTQVSVQTPAFASLATRASLARVLGSFSPGDECDGAHVGTARSPRFAPRFRAARDLPVPPRAIVPPHPPCCAPTAYILVAPAR